MRIIERRKCKSDEVTDFGLYLNTAQMKTYTYMHAARLENVFHPQTTFTKTHRSHEKQRGYACRCDRAGWAFYC